eukprot:3933884-Rhodomonas_salina.1
MELRVGQYDRGSTKVRVGQYARGSTDVSVGQYDRNRRAERLTSGAMRRAGSSREPWPKREKKERNWSTSSENSSSSD